MPLLCCLWRCARQCICSLRTPRSFIFEEAAAGCLGTPHPGKKLRVAAVRGLFKGVQQPEPWVKRSIMMEMRRPESHEKVELGRVGNQLDYATLREWIHHVAWSVYVCSGTLVGTSELDVPQFEIAHRTLLAVADCTVDPRRPKVWGVGGGLAKEEGGIGATGTVTMWAR